MFCPMTKSFALICDVREQRLLIRVADLVNPPIVPVLETPERDAAQSRSRKSRGNNAAVDLALLDVPLFGGQMADHDIDLGQPNLNAKSGEALDVRLHRLEGWHGLEVGPMCLEPHGVKGRAATQELARERVEAVGPRSRAARESAACAVWNASTRYSTDPSFSAKMSCRYPVSDESLITSLTTTHSRTRPR